jgi:hypothetical protein
MKLLIMPAFLLRASLNIQRYVPVIVLVMTVIRDSVFRESTTFLNTIQTDIVGY